MDNLQSLIEGAIDELQSQFEQGMDIGDLICEIADGWVPVYTNSLLDVAKSNLSLCVAQPEICLQGEGSATAVNILSATIYEAIATALRDRHSKNLFYFTCGNDETTH